MPIIRTLYQMLLGSGARCTHEGDLEFWFKSLNRQKHFVDVDQDGRIILKRVLGSGSVWDQ